MQVGRGTGAPLTPCQARSTGPDADRVSGMACLGQHGPACPRPAASSVAPLQARNPPSASVTPAAVGTLESRPAPHAAAPALCKHLARRASRGRPAPKWRPRTERRRQPARPGLGESGPLAGATSHMRWQGDEERRSAWKAS